MSPGGNAVLSPENFSDRVLALTSRFPELRQIVDDRGMPDFWQRPPGFETLVLTILEQQVSLLSAERAFDRLHSGLGKVNPATVSAAGLEQLREWGITRQKSRYIVGLADAIESGEFDLKSLETMSDDTVFDTLIRFPGIGPWTAKVYLLTALCRPDIWPPGDLALNKTIRLLLPGAGENLENTGHRWAPERAVAARLLWHHYLS